MDKKKLDEPIPTHIATTQLQAADSLNDVARVVRLWLQGWELTHFLVLELGVGSRVRLLCHDSPPALRGQTEDLDRLARDPVIARALSTPVPFLWDQEMHREAQEPYRNWAANGFEGGVAASSCHPHGQTVLVGFGSELSKLHKTPEYVVLADTSLMILYAQEATLRLAGNSVSLRPREAECLYWVEQGKTSWETSVLLGIAERTVNQYLDRAMQRLGINKKHQAAAQARALGLLPGKAPDVALKTRHG